MPRHPPNAQKSTNSTQHTTTNLTSDTGARTALGPAQPTRRAAHTRPPPTPTPPRPTNERGGQTRAPRGRRTKTTKNILDARVHYAVHNQPARNPPTTPHPPQNPPPDEPGEQSLKETGPTRRGAPNPGRTAPEPDSMPRPHNHRPPARRGNGPELKDENKRLRGRVEGAVAGRQGEPPLPARGPPRHPYPCSRPNRFETP